MPIPWTSRTFLKAAEKLPSLMNVLNILPFDVQALLGLNVLDSASFVFENHMNMLWSGVKISNEEEKFDFLDSWSVP